MMSHCSKLKDKSPRAKSLRAADLCRHKFISDQCLPPNKLVMFFVNFSIQFASFNSYSINQSTIEKQ